MTEKCIRQLELELDELYYYDETSPSCLRWKINRYSGKNYTRQVAWAGTAPEAIDGHGYYAISFRGKVLRAHLIILKLHGVEIPEGYCVDHIDQDRLNNKLSNLRVVEKILNERNMKLRSTNVSGTTGVYRYINSSCNPPKHYFVAQCAELDGSRTVKRFRIETLGEDEAYKAAVACREEMLDRLNKEGAGYTELHGKRLHG